MSDFLETGQQVLSWADDYLTNGFAGPVRPETKPGQITNSLPDSPPQSGASLEKITGDFHKNINPGLLHWNDPRFFGYFPCNNSKASVLGELIAATVGVNGMSWSTGPAATELELKMIKWLGQMIGLPWSGCLQDTASTGTLVALLAARESVSSINREGFTDEPRLTAYTSIDSHSSVTKAIRIAGIGDRWLRLIDVDNSRSMKLDSLRQQIENDIVSGYRPFFVSATVGTTSTTSIDDVAGIAKICQEHGIWLHVDAALAGSAAILPEMNWLMEGVSEADSYLFNLHKWLFTNYYCCAFFAKDPLKIKRALTINPEYLKSDQDDQVENFRDWSIQLGRGFRSLKLWYVINHFGVEGLQKKIRLHLEMTRWFADQVRNCDELCLFLEPKINTVCFYHRNESKTSELLSSINSSGHAYLTHTKIDDRFLIRASFGQTTSTMESVRSLWELIANFVK